RGTIAQHPGISGNADVTAPFQWSGPVARFSIREMAPAAVPAGRTAYDVTVTNITNSMQGLSPLVIASHPASVHGWQMGQQATKGLELLAEEGMPDQLAAEWKAVATDVATTKAHLLPGDSIVVHITANAGDVLSAASMLIQTNDGFTGLESVAPNGDHDMMAYDAGTEENTELAMDIPGPPFGGKNHGPDTNPRGTIAQHPGISGNADVKAPFQWSGPVARFSIQAASTSGTMMPGTSMPGATTPATMTPGASMPGTTMPGGGTMPGTTMPGTTMPGGGTMPGTTMPGMPETGTADPRPLLLLVLAGALGLVGLTLRRRAGLRGR
ncbi:MAG TPA: spondin domain-containing protein, partial [Chloroflexia bacterium]|nr:spondin domain-containing protein [Chloroflexia bacterium]